MHRSTRSAPASFALDSFRRELRRALYGGAAIGAGLIALPAAALDDAAGHAIRFAGQPLGMTASTADLNGDGRKDMVLGGRGGRLALYLQRSDGLFEPQPESAVSGIQVYHFSTPLLADVDADGDLDLLVGDDGGGINYFRNDGSNAAPSFTPLTGGSNPFGVVAVGEEVIPTLGDIDHDGDLDLVVGSSDGTLQHFVNGGTASAPAYAHAGTGDPFASINVSDDSAPVLGDVDGDGDLDLLVGSKAGSVRYFRNGGGSGAAAFTEITGDANPFDVPTGDYSIPSLADIDGDGDLDLIVGDKSFMPQLYRNTGTTHAPAVTAAFTGARFPTAELFVPLNGKPVLFDVDGDGDLDLVVGASDGTLREFANTGTRRAPAFAAPAGDPFSGITGASRAAPALGDVDGDGKPDLVAGAGDGTLKFWKNTGSRTAPSFAPATADPFAGITTTANAAPALADLDGDGDLDLALGGDDGVVRFFENTGSRTAPKFTVTDAFGTADAGFAGVPALVDVDGDGDLDLAVGESGGGTVLFPNTGTRSAPSFGAAVANADSPFGAMFVRDQAAPAFGDLDADGDPDLVLGAGSVTKLAMFWNVTPAATGGAGGTGGSITDGLVDDGKDGGGSGGLFAPFVSVALALSSLLRRRRAKP